MSIVDQYGNPVCSVRTFSNAADRGDRSRPPEPLYKEDFEKLIPDRDRQWILSGSRRMFENYSPLSGAITQRADNVVGRAWGPKFTGQDKEWGKIATEWLIDQWYGNCDVRGLAWDFKTLLWLDCVAVDRDGDFLVYLTEGESGYPLTQRIPANRIGQREFGSKVTKGIYQGYKISHGVVLNQFNRAIAFHVLGDTAEQDKFIPANYCVHVFDPTWHDQVRGVPAARSSLKFIYGSLNATEREQMNQLIRSSYALIEYNETGGPNFDDPSVTVGQGATADTDAAPTVESLAGGMLKYFKANGGGKLEALDNDMPGDGWDRFQNRVCRMLANSLNWPYELFWIGNEVNAALVRNLQEKARKSVEDRQDVLKSPAIFQIRYAIAKAVKVGILPKPRNQADWWKWDFQMPGKFSIDASKDAQNRREDFRIGYRARRDIAEEEGRDVEKIEDDKIEDAFRFEKKIRAREAAEGIEIDRRQLIMMTPNDPPETSKPEEDATADPAPPKKEEEE